MKLETVVVKDTWNGRTIDRPVNHDLAKYSDPTMGDPMALVESIEHLPGASYDYELDLKFRVRSLIPFNYAGELYYEYFAQVSDFKIVEVRPTGVLLEFVGQAACNVVETPLPVEVTGPWCGIARQYLLENFKLLSTKPLSEDAEIALEEDLEENHSCGVISDALVVLHDFAASPLTVAYPEAQSLEANYLGSSAKSFSSLPASELQTILDPYTDFVQTVTAPDGKAYRLLVITHED